MVLLARSGNFRLAFRAKFGNEWNDAACLAKRLSRQEWAMSGISKYLVASLMFVHAPIPAEPPPDPLARGYMGIEVQTGSLTIERVEPGQPAAKAGLKQHDVILRVGMLEPQAFDEVITHVCSLRPGAEIEIEVQRGSERKVFKVKLACRPLRLDYGSPTHDPNQTIP
jgi:predicted metalloprotease with PDZ domain